MAKESTSANYVLCGICSQRVGRSKRVPTTCEHKFHVHCIEYVSEKNKNDPFVCPTCDAPFQNVESDDESFAKCGICLGKIITSKKYFKTSHCQHEFHSGCIVKYIQSRSVPHQCPTCQVPFETKGYETLQDPCRWCGKEGKGEIFSRGYCHQCCVNATVLSRVLDYVDTKRFNFFDEYFRPLRFFFFDELQQNQRFFVMLYKNLIKSYADTITRLIKMFGSSDAHHLRAIHMLWNCVNVRNETFSLKTKKNRESVSRTRFELEWFLKDTESYPLSSDDEKYLQFMKDYAKVLIQLSTSTFSELIAKRLFTEFVKLRYYMENFENGMLRTALLEYASRNIPSDLDLFRLRDRLQAIETHHVSEDIDHIKLETCRFKLEEIVHLHFNRYNLYYCSCENCKVSTYIRSCKNFVETSLFSNQFSDALTSKNSLFQTRDFKKLYYDFTIFPTMFLR